MKTRFCAIWIGCVLLLSMTLPAYAAEMKEYVLSEIGMTVFMPSDYVVFTRDIDANDSNLSVYGLTKDGVYAHMQEQHVYLVGWDKEASNELNISMTDSPMQDLNLYSDTTLATFATSLTDEYEKMGVTFIKSEIYQHSQAKFLKIYISKPDGDYTVHGVLYHTVYADRAINLLFQTYTGQITASMEADIKNIVDHVKFHTAPQKPKPNIVPTNAFTYTDEITKTSFTVPENWVEAPVSEERKTIDAKFTSKEEEGLSILYGSLDIWNEMTDAERSGCRRSDIDNSVLTKSYISGTLGSSVDDVKMVTYGGKEFYTAVVTANQEAHGLNFALTMTHMVCVDNGYMYWFEFSGTSDHKLYKDFEALLRSVNFSAPDSEPAGGFTLGDLLFSLLITIAIYSLPIIIYRYAVKKAPVDRGKAKKITVIYGICALIVMLTLVFALQAEAAGAGSAILLWSFVNYRVLIGGSGADEEASEALERDGAIHRLKSGEFPQYIGQNPAAELPNTEPDTAMTLDACANNNGVANAPVNAETNACNPCGDVPRDSCDQCGAVPDATHLEDPNEPDK